MTGLPGVVQKPGGQSVFWGFTCPDLERFTRYRVTAVTPVEGCSCCRLHPENPPISRVARQLHSARRARRVCLLALIDPSEADFCMALADAMTKTVGRR